MLLIDTSVWIEIFRDKSKAKAIKFKKIVRERKYYLPVFAQMELLQGCKDESEWNKLSSYLAVQNYFEPNYETVWRNSARLYFELRRKGITVRSNIDCAIAITALENNLLVLHCDRDFEAIAKHTVLKQQNIKQQLSQIE